MGLTEEEANYLKSLPPPTRPFPFTLGFKRPPTRTKSNSLHLKTKSYKISSSLTGPPSPSRATWSISGPRPGLASSSRPRRTESSHSLPFSFSSPPTSPPSPDDADVRLNPFSLRPPTVNWNGFGPRLSVKKQAKTSLWAAIRNAGVPIYLNTPGFDSKSRFPYCTRESLCRPLPCSVLALSFRTWDVLFTYCNKGDARRSRSLLPRLRRGKKAFSK